MKASHKGVLLPSAAALKAAESKIREWQEGDPENEDPIAPQPSAPSQDGSREMLPAVASGLLMGMTPETPTPVGMGFGRASVGGSSGLFASPLQDRGPGRQKAKPFLSPLLKKQTPSGQLPTFTSSPLNPHRPSGAGFVSATQQLHPLAGTPVNASSTPSRPSTSVILDHAANLVTPMRPSLGITPRNTSGRTPAKFTTPFKPGMRPGEAGRAILDSPSKPAPALGSVTLSADVRAIETPRTKLAGANGKERWKAFNVGKC